MRLPPTHSTLYSLSTSEQIRNTFANTVIIHDVNYELFRKGESGHILVLVQIISSFNVALN